MPLTKSHLFKVVQKHAASRAKLAATTELEYIEAAQQRLYEFALHPGNACARIRFLGMQRHDAEALHAATDKIVDDLVRFMGDNELRHVWAENWHPHRFSVLRCSYVRLSILG